MVMAVVGRLVFLYFKGAANAQAERGEYQDFMSRVKTKAKILVTTLQITSQFPGSFRIVFPSIVMQLTNLMSFFNIDVYSLVPSDCAVRPYLPACLPAFSYASVIFGV